MTTTIEHLGTEADELDLAIYRLAVLITRREHQYDEPWAEEYVWNNGDWTAKAREIIARVYDSLAIMDQGDYDAWVQRLG